MIKCILYYIGVYLFVNRAHPAITGTEPSKTLN